MFIKLFQCQLITSKNLLVPMGRHGPSNTVLKHWKGKLQSHQQSSRRRTEQVKKLRDVGASTERLRKLVREQIQKYSSDVTTGRPRYSTSIALLWKVAMFLYFRIESVAVQACSLSCILLILSLFDRCGFYFYLSAGCRVMMPGLLRLYYVCN